MRRIAGLADDQADRTGSGGYATDVRTTLQPPQDPVAGAAGACASDLDWAVSSDRHRFAAKVRAGRAVLGWSQTELARRVGLSQRSIYRLELAAVDVRRSTVVAIETVFGAAGVDFEQCADGGFKIVVGAAPAVRQ